MLSDHEFEEDQPFGAFCLLSMMQTLSQCWVHLQVFKLSPRIHIKASRLAN